jgi:hypothetical protein
LPVFVVVVVAVVVKFQLHMYVWSGEVGERENMMENAVGC